MPLIRRNLIALSGAGVDEVAVVPATGPSEVEAAVRDFPVTLARNARLRAGPDVLGAGGPGRAVRPAGRDASSPCSDQPLITSEDVVALIAAYKKRTGGDIG